MNNFFKTIILNLIVNLNTSLFSSNKLTQQKVIQAANSCDTQTLIQAKYQGINLKSIRDKNNNLLQLVFEGLKTPWLNNSDVKECLLFLLKEGLNPQVITSEPVTLSQSGLLIDEAKALEDNRLVEILENYGAY